MTGLKHKILPITIIAVIIAIYCSVFINIKFASAGITGSGTEEDPYMIYDVDDLQALDDDGAVYLNHPVWVELANNIDASATSTWNGGLGFDPIGKYSTGKGFTGTFNGNGYTISDLTINRPSEDYVGLFSNFPTSSAVANIYNLTLTNVDIVGDDRVGGLVGTMGYANLYSVYIDGTVEGNDTTDAATGGIAGRIVTTTSTDQYEIIGCEFDGTIISANGYLGGIAGKIYGNFLIDACTAYVELIGEYAAGGLFGLIDTYGEITNCYSEVYVDSVDYTINGIGYFDLAIDGTTLDVSYCETYIEIDGTGNTYSNGYGGFCSANIDDNTTLNIEACSSYVDFTIDPSATSFASHGGFIGIAYLADGTINISKCYSEGTIVDAGDCTGGFAGNLYGLSGGEMNIWDCYARVDVDSDDTSNPAVGGFVGYMASNPDFSIDTSYSTGAVTTLSGSIYDGGFCGRDVSGDSITDECFWDTTTSGMATSDGGTGEDTANMTDRDTFDDAEWDFVTVWNIDAVINDGYPYLQTLEYGQPIVAPPSSLLATAIDSDSIYLTWENADSDEDTFTAVWMKEGSYPDDRDDEDAELIYIGNNEAHTESNLSPGTSYFFRAWTVDSDYYSSASFAGNTEILTTSGQEEISTLSVGDVIYTTSTSYTGTIVYKTSSTSDDNYEITTANDSITVSEDQLIWAYPVEDVAQDIDEYYHQLWDAYNSNYEAIVSNEYDDTNITVYDIIHTGSYSYLMAGDDYILARSMGEWSTSYDYDFTTTTMGSGTDVEGPDMPDWWFNVPSCTAYEGIPILYHIIEESSDAYEMPITSVCVILTFGLILLCGVITFLIVRTAPIPILVETVLVAFAAIAQLIPGVFILLAIILGGLTIFLWNKLS